VTAGVARRSPARPPVSGAVLAGGRSRRLGRDKRLVAVDGEALLARTVRVLAAVADDVTVVIADEEDRRLVTATVAGVVTPDRLRTVVDARPDAGPAAGLEAALAVAANPWTLVVAVDHPALSPAVLALLADAAHEVGDAAHAAVALEGLRGPEPLLAAYRRDASARVTALLDAGTRRLVDVLAGLDPLVLPPAVWRELDPTGSVLRDVDVPADLTGTDAAGT